MLPFLECCPPTSTPLSCVHGWCLLNCHLPPRSVPHIESPFMTLPCFTSFVVLNPHLVLNLHHLPYLLVQLFSVSTPLKYNFHEARVFPISSLKFPQHLEQFLVHSSVSVSICWMNQWKKTYWNCNKMAALSLDRLGFWDCSTSNWLWDIGQITSPIIFSSLNYKHQDDTDNVELSLNPVLLKVGKTPALFFVFWDRASLKRPPCSHILRENLLPPCLNESNKTQLHPSSWLP